MNISQSHQIKSVFSSALTLWSKNLPYIILKNLLVFGTVLFCWTMLVTPELQAEIAKIQASGKDLATLNARMEALLAQPAFNNLILKFLLVSILLKPLEVGLLELFSKTQRNETRRLTDIFQGYRGADFLRYLSYFVIYSFLDSLTAYFLPLRILLMAGTFLVLPIMYRYRLASFTALPIGVGAFVRKPLILMLLFLVGGLLNWSGLVFFGAGLLGTLGFSTAVAYAAAQAFIKIEISGKEQ